MSIFYCKSTTDSKVVNNSAHICKIMRKSCTDTELLISYNVDMFQHFGKYFDVERAQELPFGGFGDRCDVCNLAFLGKKKRPAKSQYGHGQGQTHFCPKAHYFSEVCS